MTTRVARSGAHVAIKRSSQPEGANGRRWGRRSFAAAAWEALPRFEPVPITIRLSGSDDTHAAAAPESVTCQALQLAVVNLPLFGGALRLRLPGAAVGNGLL